MCQYCSSFRPTVFSYTVAYIDCIMVIIIIQRRSNILQHLSISFLVAHVLYTSSPSPCMQSVPDALINVTITSNARGLKCCPGWAPFDGNPPHQEMSSLFSSSRQPIMTQIHSLWGRETQRQHGWRGVDPVPSVTFVHLTDDNTLLSLCPIRDPILVKVQPFSVAAVNASGQS